MGNYGWDFRTLVPFVPAFLRGLGRTIELAFLSSLLGTLFGLPIALLLRIRGVRISVAFGVDVIRAVPNLVLILFFYYLPYRELFGITPVSGFSATLWALVLAQAAYSADLIRAALEQVPRNQVLGVQALGFTTLATVRHVIVPSVIRQVLPAHVALWIGNIKLSSLASVVAVEEVVYVARVAMSQNFRSLESWLAVAAIYVAIVLPLTYGQRQLETSAWARRQ